MSDFLSSLLERTGLASRDLGVLLDYYRFVSWLVTSAFYLAGPPASPMDLKAGVILCLLLEAYVFVRAYRGAAGDERYQKLLVGVETVGLACILIVTGGLDSPFLWYAINPILLSATLSPAYVSWIMAALFASLASLMHRHALYLPDGSPGVWPDRASFFLVFALITLAAQLYNHLIRTLTKQTETLERQMEHIRALYDATETLSQRNDIREIASLFASYGKTLTGATKVIVWIRGGDFTPDGDGEGLYEVRGPRTTFPEEIWHSYLQNLVREGIAGEGPVTRRFVFEETDPPGMLVTVTVRSDTDVFGVLSAFYEKHMHAPAEVRGTLTFLGNLCAAAIEKKALESVADQFLLMEEKDRIAAEIHDNVLQNLFGLVSGLGAITRDEGLGQQLRDRIAMYERLAQSSMKELRRSIYSMSSAKGETAPFVEECQRYLRDLAELNGIELDFRHRGHFGTMGAAVSKAFYRILREATANAIRHSYCNKVTVLLESDEGGMKLQVTDDGHGFDSSISAVRESSGLGLVTMRETARNVGGILSIDSAPGEGTTVTFELEPEASREHAASGGGRL